MPNERSLPYSNNTAAPIMAALPPASSKGTGRRGETINPPTPRARKHSAVLYCMGTMPGKTWTRTPSRACQPNNTATARPTTHQQMQVVRLSQRLPSERLDLKQPARLFSRSPQHSAERETSGCSASALRDTTVNGPHPVIQISRPEKRQLLNNSSDHSTRMYAFLGKTTAGLHSA